MRGPEKVAAPGSAPIRRVRVRTTVLRRLVRVDLRTRQAPHLADHRERVLSPRRMTYAGQRFKGLFSSSAHPLSSRSSSASHIRIVISPSFARVRTSSRTPGSRLRLFSPCGPRSMNTRRHSSSSCGATYVSRLTSTRSSPRSSRSTTSTFRGALHCSGGVPPPPPVASDSTCSRSIRISLISSGPQLRLRSTVQRNPGR